jgi:FkbH-like protein
MANANCAFDNLLTQTSRSALQAGLAQWPAGLTLTQAEQLRVRALALEGSPRPLRLAVVHTYTSDLLEPWLAMHAALEGFELQTYHAPYGMTVQQATSGSALLAHRPDLTLLMLRRDDLDPELSRPFVALPGTRLTALRERSVARLVEITAAFRAHNVGQILVTLLPSPLPASLGQHDAQAEMSEAAWWQVTKSALCERLRSELPATTFIDLDDIQAQVGRRAFYDVRYWYSASYPFSAAAAAEFARRVAVVATLLKSPRAKVLVLDADNTLWGGVVGEDGIDGIALGPEYPGNVFVDFQRRLLAFQQRGLILAMCSKNNPTDVDQVLRHHPHQILRDAHFAARRVNWLPKADNLRSLAEELNLGLDSFVFVDDSDHECAAVRHALPQMQVVQVPKRAVDVPACLDRIARLEVLTLTTEDLAKTELYAQERLRRELNDDIGRGGGNQSDYLSRLQMKMRISVDPIAHLARLAQLTQKTNQFNLTTRRYDEQRMRRFIEDRETLVLDFSLADTFGDSGIVGLAIWRRVGGGCAELDTFLMSCRVIGRMAESAFLAAGLRLLAAEGITHVVADFLPTAKNDLVREFLPQHGFEADGRVRWTRTLTQIADDYPIEVTLTTGEAVSSTVAA